MKKYSNLEALEIFKNKVIISNNDGSIWVADDMRIISSHKEEYKTSNLPILECKFPHVRGFGTKKVDFTGLEKTEYIRENFPNDFHSCSLMTKNIENIIK